MLYFRRGTARAHEFYHILSRFGRRSNGVEEVTNPVVVRRTLSVPQLPSLLATLPADEGPSSSALSVGRVLNKTTRPKTSPQKGAAVKIRIDPDLLKAAPFPTVANPRPGSSRGISSGDEVLLKDIFNTVNHDLHKDNQSAPPQIQSFEKGHGIPSPSKVFDEPDLINTTSKPITTVNSGSTTRLLRNKLSSVSIKSKFKLFMPNSLKNQKSNENIIDEMESLSFSTVTTPLQTGSSSTASSPSFFPTAFLKRSIGYKSLKRAEEGKAPSSPILIRPVSEFEMMDKKIEDEGLVGLGIKVEKSTSINSDTSSPNKIKHRPPHLNLAKTNVSPATQPSWSLSPAILSPLSSDFLSAPIAPSNNSQSTTIQSMLEQRNAELHQSIHKLQTDNSQLKRRGEKSKERIERLETTLEEALLENEEQRITFAEALSRKELECSRLRREVTLMGEEIVAKDSELSRLIWLESHQSQQVNTSHFSSDNTDSPDHSFDQSGSSISAKSVHSLATPPENSTAVFNKSDSGSNELLTMVEAIRKEDAEEIEGEFLQDKWARMLGEGQMID